MLAIYCHLKKENENVLKFHMNSNFCFEISTSL